MSSETFLSQSGCVIIDFGLERGLDDAGLFLDEVAVIATVGVKTLFMSTISD